MDNSVVEPTACTEEPVQMDDIETEALENLSLLDLMLDEHHQSDVDDSTKPLDDSDRQDQHDIIDDDTVEVKDEAVLDHVRMETSQEDEKTDLPPAPTTVQQATINDNEETLSRSILQPVGDNEDAEQRQATRQLARIDEETELLDDVVASKSPNRDDTQERHLVRSEVASDEPECGHTSHISHQPDGNSDTGTDQCAPASNFTPRRPGLDACSGPELNIEEAECRINTMQNNDALIIDRSTASNHGDKTVEVSSVDDVLINVKAQQQASIDAKTDDSSTNKMEEGQRTAVAQQQPLDNKKKRRRSKKDLLFRKQSSKSDLLVPQIVVEDTSETERQLQQQQQQDNERDVTECKLARLLNS